MSEEFCEYLRTYRWKGDMYALPEGTVCYPHVQMVRIESRPARNGFWDYNFFIDVEGSVETPGVREALAAMEARTEHWRLLGSYPVVD